MTFRDATAKDLWEVGQHLRPCDVEEQFARRFDDDRQSLHRDLLWLRDRAIKQFAFCDRDGRPACVLSAYLASPGVAQLHAMSTDRWPDVARAVFLCGVRHLMPAIAASVHRAQCETLASNVAWRDILRRLGFVEEGIARAAGRDGQDFVHAAWLNPTIDAARRPVVCGPMAPGPGDD